MNHVRNNLESVGVPGLAVLEEGDVRHLVVLVQHTSTGRISIVDNNLKGQKINENRKYK